MSIGEEWDQYRRQTVYTVSIGEERDQETDCLNCEHWRGEGPGDGLFTL